MPDFNIQDPSKQEAVRRKSHDYVAGEGRHGTYVEKPYHHQEYPKVMDTTPAPVRKSFKTDDDFKAALADFEDVQKQSIVNSKTEEERWLAANGKKTRTTIVVDPLPPKRKPKQPAAPATPAAPVKRGKTKAA